jgi:NAD(P)-dependent dehydrogenase (short-subunit alcohol dehydrogenase family)
MTASMPLKALESITSDIPVGRLGKPSDVARAVNFLVDRNASYITGADININGGLVMV